jgi:hypothetical protein
MPIDHLGCRYFDLVPPKAGTDAVLAVEVSPRPEQTSSPAQNALRCELVTISKNGRNVTRTRLDLHADGRQTGSVPGFADATVERVILVLANCAFGSGWAYNDGLQFRISAWLE